MPVTFSSPEYSFVRFSNQFINGTDWHEHAVPGAGIGWCLPVLVPDATTFQVFIEGTSATHTSIFCSNVPTALTFALFANGTISTTFTLAQATHTWAYNQITVERYRLSLTKVVLQITLPSDLFNHVDCGECFQLGLFYSDGVLADASAFSNCMIRVCNADYLTRVTYRSDADEAGFVYCAADTLLNKLHLPFYLTRPTLPEEETVYRRSDGSAQVTKASVEEVWELVSDAMPQWAIKCLRALFLHDSIAVISLPFTGKIVKKGAFDVEHIDFLNYPLSTPKLKVSTTPFLLKNDNCGECEELAYGIVANYHTLPEVGFVTPTGSYVVDLSTLTSSPCCSPVAYQITYGLGAVVLGYSLVGSVLTINYQQLGGPNTQLVGVMKFQAACGNATSNEAFIYAWV